MNRIVHYKQQSLDAVSLDGCHIDAVSLDGCHIAGLERAEMYSRANSGRHGDDDEPV
jgi:hypothetical protein